MALVKVRHPPPPGTLVSPQQLGPSGGPQVHGENAASKGEGRALGKGS